MKRSLLQLQLLSLANTPCHQPIPAQVADGLDRVELLVPQAARSRSRNMLEYALAYVERYQGNVPQLEHEREFLYAALNLAWQQTEYAIVIRLVAGLAHLVGRLNPAQAEYILHLGIEACRSIQDRQHLILFLNRLGGLLFAQGKYQQGQRIWRAGLRLARFVGSFPGFWEPLASFVYIVDMLGSSPTDQQIVKAFLTSRADDPDICAVALFSKGFYARFTHDLDGACEHFSDCLRLLSLHAPAAPSSCYQQLFTVVVQTELARAQGHYTRSQEYTETALALAHVFSDPYTVADLLTDQIFFTYFQGQLADAHTSLQRLYDMALQGETPNLYGRCLRIEQRLNRISVENGYPPLGHQQAAVLAPASAELQEPLSERECEVLQLVAEGLSNRDIGRRLVITPGTVKKHLEHIYIKLGVHSRTAAIARVRAHQHLA